MDFELSPRFVEEDFCRLCLSSIYELRMLFPRGSIESHLILITKISLLAEVIIVPSEELNARICSRCVKQLEEFDSFRRRCKDSDNQIRKIRAFRQQQEVRATTTAKEDNRAEGIASVRPSEVAITAAEKFDGIFDLMTFCEDSATPGEYRMLFDGFVYRRESLLVWRCELAICPCQLIVDHGCWKLRIYGAHTHGKIPLENDKRKYEKINQTICSFLNKLRDQIDGTCANRLQQCTASSTQQLQEPVHSLEEGTATIYYATKGDRPSIVLDGHQYHKEAASSGIVPSEINWRCTEKNCLGMVVTTTDLKRFQMHKNHNHEPIVRTLSGAPDDYILKISAAPMISETPQTAPFSAATLAPSNTVTIANIQLSVEPMPAQVSVVPRTNLTGKSMPQECPGPRQESNGDSVANKPVTALGPLVRWVTTAPMMNTSETLQQQQPSSSATPNENPKPAQSAPNQLPPITILPTTSSNQANATFQPPTTTDGAPPVAAIVPVIMSAASSNPNRITPCKRKEIQTTSAKELKEKLKRIISKPPVHNSIVPNIAFRRCPDTNGICLIHKQFVYSSHPTNSFIAWHCKADNCTGMIRTGWQFEYLATCVEHNHSPPVSAADTVVDVERHLAVTDALKKLAQLRSNLARNIVAEGLKQRRKSTRS